MARLPHFKRLVAITVSMFPGEMFLKCTQSFLRSISGSFFFFYSLDIQKLDLPLMKAAWLKNLLLMPFVLT